MLFILTIFHNFSYAILSISLQSSFYLFRNIVSQHRILRAAQTIVYDSRFVTYRQTTGAIQSEFCSIDQLRHLSFLPTITLKTLLLRSSRYFV